MLKRLMLVAALFTTACATVADRAPPAPIAQPACALSAEDSAWIERALTAWRFTSREITHVGRVRNFQAVFFDADCVLTSSDALTADDGAAVTWSAANHGDAITLPDGKEIPVGVTSFSMADETSAYFVMSTPSVWRAGGVNNEALGLETMMVAVLLHEGSHVAQMPTYGARVGALAERYHLPDGFNDDGLQARFGDDADFSASIARETDLFFQAATAPNTAAARRFAGEARGMMRVRALRWYVGDDAYWTEAEDIWLTFEGAGQWAGYQWVIDPRGANVPVAVAMPNFGRRSRWWSQNEGLAIFLALDRIVGPGWKHHVYGDGEQTILQMLDAALADN